MKVNDRRMRRARLIRDGLSWRQACLKSGYSLATANRGPRGYMAGKPGVQKDFARAAEEASYKPEFVKKAVTHRLMKAIIEGRKAALAFLSESGITALRVEGLEIRQQPLTFGEGSLLTLEQLPDVIGRILREDFWCRLQAHHGFVHFGWDYYMYIGVPRPCPVAEQTASELGLYVEEFASPYHENGGN